MKKIFVIIVIFISFLSGQNFDVASVGMAGNYTAHGLESRKFVQRKGQFF